MPFGWEGERVRLVPLERQRHFDNCVRWLNDPDITQWTLIGDFPLTRLAEEEFFDRFARATENATDVGFAIELMNEEEEHIGAAGLHAISYRHGTTVIGLFIGRKQLWSHGYGTDTLSVLTRYAFAVAGLRLLLAEVMHENIASLRALQKNGYREVGRVPQRWWKRGSYRDVVQMALPRDEWKP